MHGVPADCKKTKATKVVQDNGFNPIWNETATFQVRVKGRGLTVAAYCLYLSSREKGSVFCYFAGVCELGVGFVLLVCVVRACAGVCAVVVLFVCLYVCVSVCSVGCVFVFYVFLCFCVRFIGCLLVCLPFIRIARKVGYGYAEEVCQASSLLAGVLVCKNNWLPVCVCGVCARLGASYYTLLSREPDADQECWRCGTVARCVQR